MCKYLTLFFKLTCFYFIILMFSKTKFNEFKLTFMEGLSCITKLHLFFSSLEIPIMIHDSCEAWT